MGRNLIQMTQKIFSNISANICDDHKDFIVNAERHIDLDRAYKDECCEFLINATIIGMAHEKRPTIFFVKHCGREYIGIDTNYAEEFEKYGYILENDSAVNVGSQLLSLSENIYKMRADSKELIEECLGKAPEGEKPIVFDAVDILELLCPVSIFRLDNNNLSIDLTSKDDLLRISLLFYSKQCTNLQINLKTALEDLLTMDCTRKICGNIWNFLDIPDKAIQYLNLYQCIEYLFIPNRAKEFKRKYNMSIEDALKLHINEQMRRDERNNSLEILKYAGEVTIHNMYVELIDAEECNNELEKVNNWVYDTRCSIAHFRYGQSKNDGTVLTEKHLVLMLELLKSIYTNITEEMKRICSGNVFTDVLENKSI